MRIIKTGKLESEKEYQCSCQICHTLFVFKRNETNCVYDRGENVFTINCPFCKTKNYMSNLRLYTGDK